MRLSHGSVNLGTASTSRGALTGTRAPNASILLALNARINDMESESDKAMARAAHRMAEETAEKLKEANDNDAARLMDGALGWSTVAVAATCLAVLRCLVGVWLC